MSVAIVDSGGANIASVTCALERLGVTPQLTTDAAILTGADHVILPGVGAAEDAMQRLDALGLSDVIRDLKQPVLGICLGMQLMAAGSAEDNATCLGITNDNAGRFTAAVSRPVPHMGWNCVHHNNESVLFDGIPSGAYFYFVHSYALAPSDSTVAMSHYDGDFSAAIAHNNFFGTQFHPERSAHHGARLLRNFLAM
ncbi:MAG: imidazole glycerol phosphate synthase subunit HisH [Pseudomonadota bacterium]